MALAPGSGATSVAASGAAVGSRSALTGLDAAGALVSSACGSASGFVSRAVEGVALSAAAGSAGRGLELFLAFAWERFRDLDVLRLRAEGVPFLALEAARFRAVEATPVPVSAPGS
jgi:hypothetical protein